MVKKFLIVLFGIVTLCPQISLASGSITVLDKIAGSASITIYLSDMKLVSPQKYFAECDEVATGNPTFVYSDTSTVTVGPLKPSTLYSCQAAVATPSNGAYAMSFQTGPFPSSISTTASTTPISSPVVTNNNWCAGFSDVWLTDSKCKAIEYVKTKGIFQGYSDGTFKPDAVINRAEVVKVILLGFNMTLLSDLASNYGFSDVPAGVWYGTYLRTAKSNQVIQGYSDGTFRPNAQVNRAEMYKIFFQTAALIGSNGIAKDQFANAVLYPPAYDVSENDWFAPYFNYAKVIGLMGDANNYYPQQGMTRGDVAKLFFDFNNA